MGISNIYNSIKGKAKNLTGKIGDFFDNTQYYERGPDGKMIEVDKFSQPKVQPAVQQPPQLKPGTVNPGLLSSAIRQLESSGGTHPDTPRNQKREYVIPAFNKNEKPRTVPYDVGYGGEYGLTPVGLAELAKSKPNREAPQSQYTQYGAPLIPGKSPEEIQQKLLTPEGAGELAVELFLMKRALGEDYSPEALARDYMDVYVGKGGPSYTPENYTRVLNYFKSITQQ